MCFFSHDVCGKVERNDHFNERKINEFSVITLCKAYIHVLSRENWHTFNFCQIGYRIFLRRRIFQRKLNCKYTNHVKLDNDELQKCNGKFSSSQFSCEKSMQVMIILSINIKTLTEMRDDFFVRDVILQFFL